MNRFLFYTDCIINLRNVASVSIKKTKLSRETYLEFKLNTGTASTGGSVMFQDAESNIERVYFVNEEAAKKELQNIITLGNEK